MRSAVAIAAVVTTFLWPARAEDAPGGDFALALVDQYGETVEVPETPTSEAVTLVAYSDREGADANRRWAEVLVERYRDHLEGRAEPNLRVVAVAHLRGVPFFVRAFVKRGFRGREPDGSPILPIALDWKGTVAAQLGFTPGVPNLAVIDPEGAVAARSAARADDEEAAEILSVLDALLASGAQTGVGG